MTLPILSLKYLIATRLFTYLPIAIMVGLSLGSQFNGALCAESRSFFDAGAC